MRTMEWTEDNVSWLKDLIEEGLTNNQIADVMDCTEGAISAYCQKKGIKTYQARQRESVEEKINCPKKYWLYHTLRIKNTRRKFVRGFNSKERLALLDKIELPDVCPMLGTPLDYSLGRGRKDEESTPSIDRIDNELGYIEGNMEVVSWRANRIRGQASPQELIKIATYLMEKQ